VVLRPCPVAVERPALVAAHERADVHPAAAVDRTRRRFRLGAHPHETFTPLVLRRLKAFMLQAAQAQAQDRRIADVQAGVLS
jgi:hypothetical protein